MKFIISPIVLILIFIVDRFINFWLTKRENKRNWYLTVLINPNLEKINLFYKKLFDLYEKSSNLLSQYDDDDDNFINQKKSEIFGNISILKRNFEMDFITPIYAMYPSLSEYMINELLNLEDYLSHNLDSNNYEIEQTRRRINESKSNILDALYLPISYLSNKSLEKKLNQIK